MSAAWSAHRFISEQALHDAALTGKTVTGIDSSIPNVAPRVRKLTRLGAWGLAFFAVKGFLWLIVPLIAMYFA